MKIWIDTIVKDYLALRGESPDLLPLLEEGEDSAVLTLSRELMARLPSAAVEATLQTPILFLDDVRMAECRCLQESPRSALLRMPSDYLKLYSIRMADWNENVTSVEPSDSLRRILGANAPEWMICRKNPMVTEERDEQGLSLRVIGSDAFDLPATVYYIPLPKVEDDSLTISKGAYYKMLQMLTT